MRENFLRKTGIKNVSIQVFLSVLITCFLFIKPSYSQEDSTQRPDKDGVVVLGTDGSSIPAADSATLSVNDSSGTSGKEDTAIAEEENHQVVNGYSKEAINRGKRFFLGLLPFEREHQACVSCHNIRQADTLNWNPSAYDIALKYANLDFASFQQVVKQPLGVKMEASHQNFDIGEEDLRTVKIYLDDLAATGHTPVKPSYNNLILFLFLGLLLTWALMELIFLKKIKWKIVPVLLFIGALVWQVEMIATDAIRLGRQENYAPDQPIKFSHKVHAGDNGIDCMYCHTTVEQGKSAGIPATNLCMNCHIIIREGTNSGKFEIAKVVAAAENGTPVEWNRIHNLPDHVFFSHAVHVGSGKLDCASCHGPVEEMDIMRQHSDLSMGWCVNCHRDTEVKFAGNSYYDQYIKLHEDLKSGAKQKITAEDIGANDCMRCHY